MYIYIYAHICIYIYIYTYTHIHISICAHMELSPTVSSPSWGRGAKATLACRRAHPAAPVKGLADSLFLIHQSHCIDCCISVTSIQPPIGDCCCLFGGHWRPFFGVWRSTVMLLSTPWFWRRSQAAQSSGTVRSYPWVLGSPSTNPFGAVWLLSA